MNLMLFCLSFAGRKFAGKLLHNSMIGSTDRDSNSCNGILFYPERHTLYSVLSVKPIAIRFSLNIAGYYKKKNFFQSKLWKKQNCSPCGDCYLVLRAHPGAREPWRQNDWALWRNEEFFEKLQSSSEQALRIVRLIERFTQLAMDARSLSSIFLLGNGAKAKQQTMLGSYLDIHPDWKAFMEICEPRMDGNLKETSAKEAQMKNTEEDILAATNATANSQLSDAADCASDVEGNKIETKSPSKVDEIQAGHGEGVALLNDLHEFRPGENDKGLQVSCKDAGRGDSCETTFSGQQATEPSPGSNAVSPDHDATVVRFPLGQGWAKFWYPDNTSPAITKADVQSTPSALVRPRTRPNRAADQQRRTAQSRQPDPLVGMERYHLVVVEKDFSITIQEVGLRPHGLETTEVAREAAATNTKPPRPRARKVTFNLDDPAREGRLRRGWARVSAAARRMFRRCRCCLGQN